MRVLFDGNTFWKMGVWERCGGNSQSPHSACSRLWIMLNFLRSEENFRKQAVAILNRFLDRTRLFDEADVD